MMVYTLKTDQIIKINVREVIVIFSIEKEKSTNQQSLCSYLRCLFDLPIYLKAYCD